MKERHNSAPMLFLLGALFLLTLGQLLGLLNGRGLEPEITQEQSEEAEIVTGTVIRQETPILGDGAGLVPRFADGTLVTAGETLFYPAQSGADSHWVTALAEEYSVLPLPTRRDKIAELLEVDRLSAAQGEELTALLLAENETSEWNPGKAPEGSIKATCSGLFSAYTDGLEPVLTPEDPWPLISLPMGHGEKAAGKIVLSDEWYFAAVLSFCPEEPLTVEVLTEEPFFTEFTPERAEPLGDRWRVLFRCREDCGRVINCRELSVIFSS